MNNVVYEIFYNHCDTKFVGESSRSAERRLTEHQKAVGKQWRTAMCRNTHYMTSKCQRFNCKDRKILLTEEYEEPRKLKETNTKLTESYGRTGRYCLFCLGWSEFTSPTVISFLF